MSECCNISPFYMGVGNKRFENRVIEIVKEQITSIIEKIVKEDIPTFEYDSESELLIINNLKKAK